MHLRVTMSKKKIGKGLNVLTKYVINQLKELCNISSLSALKGRKKEITFAIPIASITDKTHTKVYAWHPRMKRFAVFLTHRFHDELDHGTVH